MDRERITISIKKNVLDKIDRVIDGSSIRNRSHAIESLTLKGLGSNDTSSAVVVLGGDDALKAIPNTKKILAELSKFGFDRVHIAVGFLGDKIREKLGSGEEFGLTFTYSDKGEGSGGALATLKKELRGTFLVINHNRFDQLDIKNLLSFHRNHNFIATIATDDLKSMQGVYVFDTEVLAEIPRGFSMLEDDILPKLIKNDKAAVCPVIK